MGEKGNKFMYHYIKDKEFLSKLHSTCADIVNQLVVEINKDSVMKVSAYLVGSGAKKLITQNGDQEVDFARGTRLTVFNSPRKYQDVSGFEGYFLVDRNEEGYCGVCSYLRCMSESKGRTSEASRIVTTVADTRMEVG